MKKRLIHRSKPSALDALVSQLIVLATTPLFQQVSTALAPATQVVLGGAL